MMILIVIMNLATCQLDYTAAFIHTPIDAEVFGEMLHGFATPGKAYKLKYSRYGLKQTP